MRITPSGREIRRAERRLLRRVFGAMLIEKVVLEPTPPYQLPPLEDAKRQYVELFGSALVMNTYLKIALLCVSLIAVGLLLLNFRTQSKYANVKPLVIRIDEVGRAQAVQYDTLTYAPQ